MYFKENQFKRKKNLLFGLKASLYASFISSVYYISVNSHRNSYMMILGCSCTLRLALERWWLRLLNLQPSVPGVSALSWMSGVSEEPPPDMGKIPRDWGRSFLCNVNKIKNHLCSDVIECYILFLLSSTDTRIVFISPNSAKCCCVRGLSSRLLRPDPFHMFHVVVDHLKNKLTKSRQINWP